MLLATICASDLFWTICETSTTNFARTSEGWIIVEEEKDAKELAHTKF